MNKELFPEARSECFEVIERVIHDSESDGIAEMLRGERRRLDEFPVGEYLRERRPFWGHRWGAFAFLVDKCKEYELPEEKDAALVARQAREAFDPARTCGSCGRDVAPEEPICFGSEVYVGFPPLRGGLFHELRVCQPLYERTVLCETCAPDWLSAKAETAVSQRCAFCERVMVFPLSVREMRRSFCSESCSRAYHGRLRKERRTEDRKKVCEVCGGAFVATRKDAKTCSPKCKQRAYRERHRNSRSDSG